MNITVSQTKKALGKLAAQKGAELIQEAIHKNGEANIIVATGASQFEMLEELVLLDVDWSKVIGFHLDEYIGLPSTHPASFRKYLKERFVDIVNLRGFNYINTEYSPEKECGRLKDRIAHLAIDVAFIGIGENGHLAFNDPPADFSTEEPYIIVNLDKACREQQMGEGWFKKLDEVPKQAISMSVRQILKSKSIICSVPDLRKANAIKDTVESNKVSPLVPSSILYEHKATWLYLDENSASLLQGQK